MFVAGAAFVENQHSEGRLVHPADGVGSVAVDANRQLLVGLGDFLAVDRTLELFGYAEVTLGTGIDDIIPVNA